jgi:hypothetical protein
MNNDFWDDVTLYVMAFSMAIGIAYFIAMTIYVTFAVI